MALFGKAPAPPKALLDNIGGYITGGLWGILGASGSGKTTFLSTLALRLDTRAMRMVGEIHINGKTYNKHLLKAMSGYVMQDDLVQATLTVYETLMYTSALRMSGTATKHERHQRVEECMNVMGIGYCRNVIVGDTRNKGISGGERKRLCVAMELLTKPALLFLDECTSGLDSTTALSLMNTLKTLCEKGQCTIVCTIHQPQTKIYNLLDNLILMKTGRIIYQGGCAGAEYFFAQGGYPCPPKMNPADHILEVITLGTDGDKAAAADGSTSVKPLYVPVNLDFGLDKDDFTLRAMPHWVYQYGTLLHRNWMDKRRRWDVVAVNILVTAILAVFISCGAWSNLSNDQAGLAKRNPLLFFTVMHQGIIASIQGTHSFPLERALMLRERAAGSYYCSAYFLAKVTVDSFVQILSPIVFTAFVYPLCGLNLHKVDKVFIFMGFQMLLCNCAVALSNMCSCLCVSIEMSVVVLSCAMEISRQYGAFFVSPVLLDDYYQWKFFDQISYIKYGFMGIALNEYSDLQLTCTAVQRAGGLATCKPTGEAYADTLGYRRFTIPYAAGCCVAYIVVCRVVSYLALRFITV